MDNDELYHFLKERCTVTHMKELALTIIDAYKAKDHRALARMMERVVPDSSMAEPKGNAMFFTLIKFFHPDRHAAIMTDIDDSYRNGDGKKLAFYKKIFFTLPAEKDDRRRDLVVEFEEVYGYDHCDYADYSTDEIVSETEKEFDFYSAVKTALYGNLNFDIGPEDLEFLAGDLDLSDCGLDDIDGIEYCVRITSLDLSKNSITHIENIEQLADLRELSLADNQISDIESLKGLFNLEMLDVSDNEIEDASVLLNLEHLRFLDIRNNPLSDRTVLSILKERSVVVIE